MDHLVSRLGMLSGLTVVFGNAQHAQRYSAGVAREVAWENGQWQPAPLALQADTLYDLASLTKLFTLLCVLHLLEEKALALQDCIGQVDGRFVHLGECSLYDTLTYQAPLCSPQRIDAQPDLEGALKQVFAVCRLKEEPPRLYSDMNALVLKYVVEKISGKPFAACVQDWICAPCGMTQTYDRVPDGHIADCLDYRYEHRVLNGEYVVLEGPAPGLPHDPKARLILQQGGGLSGHAGLFATAGDMARLCQGLLQGKVISLDTLASIGRNRTGRSGAGRQYRQYLGLLCFAKSPQQYLSEVPSWMGQQAFAVSGYTGNHLALDPDLGVFDVFLGNRCHNRVSRIEPAGAAQRLGLDEQGAGWIGWPDGRRVRSSYQYIHLKDALLHRPVLEYLREYHWIGETA